MTRERDAGIDEKMINAAKNVTQKHFKVEFFRNEISAGILRPSLTFF